MKLVYSDLAGTQLVATSDYSFDGNGRLTDLTHQRGSTVLADYGFVYDAVNRITQMTSPDGVSDYTYDLTNQLTGAEYDYQTDEAYSYDANGNRTNAGYGTGTYNQLLTDGVYAYEYDAEGNRTKRTEIATGEVTEYVWDYRNRLTEVRMKDASGTLLSSAAYTYDVNNQRIAKVVDADGAGSATPTTERFVYDGDHIALTFDGTGTQTERFFYGPTIDQIIAQEGPGGLVYWALSDHLGSIRDVLNNSGQIVNHLTYDSFGDITNETNPAVDFRFSYTGREFDEETEQYYYRARYYDAGVGWFLSEDPSRFGGNDWNLYRYVGNSSISNIDPLGLYKIQIHWRAVAQTEWIRKPTSAISRAIDGIDQKDKGLAAWHADIVTEWNEQEKTKADCKNQYKAMGYTYYNTYWMTEVGGKLVYREREEKIPWSYRNKDQANPEKTTIFTEYYVSAGQLVTRQLPSPSTDSNPDPHNVAKQKVYYSGGDRPDKELNEAIKAEFRNLAKMNLDYSKNPLGRLNPLKATRGANSNSAAYEVLRSIAKSHPRYGFKLTEPIVSAPLWQVDPYTGKTDGLTDTFD